MTSNCKSNINNVKIIQSEAHNIDWIITYEDFWKWPNTGENEKTKVDDIAIILSHCNIPPEESRDHQALIFNI